MNDTQDAFRILLAHIKIQVLVCSIEGEVQAFSLAAKNALLKHTHQTIAEGHTLFAYFDAQVMMLGLKTLQAPYASDTPFSMVTMMMDEQLVRLSFLPIFDGKGACFNFMLKIEPIEDEAVQGEGVRHYQTLIEQVRARLSGIRAAIETLMSYPQMDAVVADQFRQIIFDEAVTLSSTIEAAQTAYSDQLRAQKEPDRMLLHDWGRYVQRFARAESDFSVAVRYADFPSWFEVDREMMVHALFFLLRRIRNTLKVHHFDLYFSVEAGDVWMDLDWRGNAIRSDRVERWLDHVITEADMAVPLTFKTVLEEHQAVLIHQPSENVKLRISVPQHPWEVVLHHDARLI